MASHPNGTNSRISSWCVYIGNTSSIDELCLVQYCSKFGTVVSCSLESCPPEKRPFCDFRIVRFATEEQLQNFLHHPHHQIESLVLDVKCYRTLLDNCDMLNVERKLFVGPISNPSNINTIVQFYKLIDGALQYRHAQYEGQLQILIDFSNRQFIRTVIQQQTIPSMIDNEVLSIYPAVHPKEFVSKIMSTTSNKHCQLRIHGLTENITERVLM